METTQLKRDQIMDQLNELVHYTIQERCSDMEIENLHNNLFWTPLDEQIAFQRKIINTIMEITNLLDVTEAELEAKIKLLESRCGWKKSTSGTWHFTDGKHPHCNPNGWARSAPVLYGELLPEPPTGAKVCKRCSCGC